MKELLDYMPKASVRSVLKVAGLSVGAWYDKRVGKEQKQRRGPQPKHSDQEVYEAIVNYLKAPKFYNEGYKKLRTRLLARGIRVGKERLRRILGEHGLLVHQGNRGSGQSHKHKGRIITERPNAMWGMDIKEWRTAIGKLYFFDVVDHFNSEIKGWHVSMSCTRHDALEGLRDAVRRTFGSIEEGICREERLSLRVDHGSQFDARDFERELIFLGIHKSSAYMRSPECNGVVERFHRTIKEQLVGIQCIGELKEAIQKIGHFIDRYNEDWLLHRMNLSSPLAYRQKYLSSGNTEPEVVCSTSRRLDHY